MCDNLTGPKIRQGVFMLAILLVVTAPSVLFGQGLKVKGEVSKGEVYNPHPEADDLELPMPCGGKMAFKAIGITAKGYLWDLETKFGCDTCGRSENGYYERCYLGGVSGPFRLQDFPEAWRSKIAADTSSNAAKFYYLIGKYEVTNFQWRSVMGDSCPSSNALAVDDALPKTDVSWFEAIMFTQRYSSWLLENAPALLPSFAGDNKNTGYVRLPTEAEWEYAARGGHNVSLQSLKQEEFFEHDSSTPLTDYAVFRPEGAARIEESPLRIGSRKANPAGLYDTAGNVAEMVLDLFHFSLGGRLHGSAGGFIRKGGSYLSGKNEIMPGRREEGALFLRNGPNKAKDLGVRVVISSINTPGGNRQAILINEWKKAGEDYNFTIDQTKNPLEEIDRIIQLSKNEQEKNNLLMLRGILKDNNIALERQRNTAAESLIRNAIFLIETAINYARDKRVVQNTLASIMLEKNEYMKKTDKKDIDFEATIKKAKIGEEKFEAAMKASIALYRAKIEECQNFPEGIITSQFAVVQNDLVSNDVLTQNLKKNLATFKKHFSLYRKGERNFLKNEKLIEDIIPKKIR